MILKVSYFHNDLILFIESWRLNLQFIKNNRLTWCIKVILLYLSKYKILEFDVLFILEAFILDDLVGLGSHLLKFDLLTEMLLEPLHLLVTIVSFSYIDQVFTTLNELMAES